MFCAIPYFIIILSAQIVVWLRFTKIPNASGRTVLLTGGKMTKCLQLARMFHAMGDRVIVAETPQYKYCGTRFSNAVAQFCKIPPIHVAGEAYQSALVNIAEKEQVDLFVPVASPSAAVVDAYAKPNFPDHTQVFHFNASIVEKLDDKHQFLMLCKEFGLSAPESYLIDDKERLLSHNFVQGKKYMLKKIAYDPVYRMDLRPLPHPDWQNRIKKLPISKHDKWVLQEFIDGEEICTHTTTINGRTNLYVCSESSPFQVNYVMKHLPQVAEWTQSFVQKLGATGQISFDFIVTKEGTVMPIECNPRTHSAITLFHNQPEAIAAYYSSEKQAQTFIPNKESGHTFWIFHELYRLLTAGSLSRFVFLLKRIYTGKEAIFSWDDPWPFWMHYFIHIPYQLIKCTADGIEWTKIDFNIGKLIVKGGD